MKLDNKHAEEISKALIEKFGSTGFVNVCSHLRSKAMTPMRIRWDLLRAVKSDAEVCDYYKIDGVNDDHIDTMLRKVFLDFGMSWYASKIAPRSMEMTRQIGERSCRLEVWHSGTGTFEIERRTTSFRSGLFSVKNYGDILRIIQYEEMVLNFYKQPDWNEYKSNRAMLADAFAASVGIKDRDLEVLREWSKKTLFENA